MNPRQKEKLVRRRVTYNLELRGEFYIVENVPARVDEKTGEQFFAPSTVERLQAIVLGHRRLRKTIETPVFEYVE